jgi:hypothetical protein
VPSRAAAPLTAIKSNWPAAVPPSSTSSTELEVSVRSPVMFSVPGEVPARSVPLLVSVDPVTSTVPVPWITPPVSLARPLATCSVLPVATVIVPVLPAVCAPARIRLCWTSSTFWLARSAFSVLDAAPPAVVEAIVPVLTS